MLGIVYSLCSCSLLQLRLFAFIAAILSAKTAMTWLIFIRLANRSKQLLRLGNCWASELNRPVAMVDFLAPLLRPSSSPDPNCLKRGCICWCWD